MAVQMTLRQAAWLTSFVIMGLVFTLMGSGTVLAQAWPTRSITAIAPFAAGSAADVVGRITLGQVSRQIGQQIVVENRGGAGGTLGANVVAKTPADGYSVLVTGALPATNALYSKLPYDTLRDFAPVIVLGLQPLVVVTGPSNGFKTLNDLIAAGKAKPGVLNFGSGGIGSATHLAAERLRISAGFEAQHIPFKGPAEALTEVLAGRLDFFVVPIGLALPLVKDGQIIALAISSSKRTAALPQVPTTTESGLADSAYDFWVGLFVPAKTPREIMVRLHDETEAALKVAAVQERLSNLGIEPIPMSLQQVDKYFRDDVQANAKLVKAANIPAQ